MTITCSAIVLLAVFVLFYIVRLRLVKNLLEFSVVCVLITAAFVPRMLLLSHKTLDYVYFLEEWVQFFRDNGGFAALKSPIGNYNLPYLYLLAVISYIPIEDMYLIKLSSIVFDVVLAFSARRLVSVFTENRFRQLACLVAVLILPTTILNSSAWAQCDSIYASFAILSIYFALKDKPVWSIIMLTLSFGFKLQAVFIMPVFFLFLFAKKIRWYHLPVAPATYCVLLLPAVIAGRPFMDAIMLYFHQVGSVGEEMNYNAPTIYAFFGKFSNPELAEYGGIAVSFLFVLIILIIAFAKRRSLNNRALFSAALIFCIGVPFFLPHMHDRYFFMADILALCLAAVNLKRIPVPILVIFASLLGYYAFLTERYFLTMNYGAIALIIAAPFLFYDFFSAMRKKPAGTVKTT